MPDRFLMATTAVHVFRDISRAEPDLAVIYGEDGDDWIGEWVTGFGLINVRFPKSTTRELTEAERARYDGRLVRAGAGMWRIEIPQEDA